MFVPGTKETFINHNQNDHFRVPSGNSERQCLLLGMEQPSFLAQSNGSL